MCLLSIQYHIISNRNFSIDIITGCHTLRSFRSFLGRLKVSRWRLVDDGKIVARLAVSGSSAMVWKCSSDFGMLVSRLKPGDSVLVRFHPEEQLSVFVVLVRAQARVVEAGVHLNQVASKTGAEFTQEVSKAS